MQANMLEKNADKREFIVFNSERNVYGNSLTVGELNIKSSSCVRKLGAWLDSMKNMEQHVNSVLNLVFDKSDNT